MDPRVEVLVKDRQSLSQEDSAQAIEIAKREAGLDQAQNKVIIESAGRTYWGAEYPNVFTFNGILRGNFEHIHKDVDQRDNGEQVAIAGPGGESTHVVIETDDGHVFVIRRTNDKKSAALQTFELSSTTMHMGQEGDELLTREVGTDQLKDVVVMPGYPLVLSPGEDGKSMRTKGNVTRITSLQRTEEGSVAEGHPYLQKDDMRRNPSGEFLAAVETARTMSAAEAIGPLAVQA